MLKLYNTFTRQIEKFKPLTRKRASIYGCGPTVYSRQHIGNLRKNVFDDLLKRTLQVNGFTTYSVTNITDVGHLVSDADDGEDKMEKGSQTTGQTAQDIAQYYTSLWQADLAKLNIRPDNHYPRATEYIRHQINLIKRLEKKGYTYLTSDGVYFNSQKLPTYGQLARLNPEHIQEGSRVNMGEKLHGTDFALWKFSQPPGKRQQEWDSPWGVGFPGWHSECVVMSENILHTPFDIHTGGKEHIDIHHTNEIAQVEADKSTAMASYWLHSYHLTYNGQKMAKSQGTSVTLDEIIERGYSPLSLRLLFLMGHYRSDIDFSWEALEQAEHSLRRIYTFLNRVYAQPHKRNKPLEYQAKTLVKQVRQSLNNDLDTPQALATIFTQITKWNSNIDNQEPIPRRHLIKAFYTIDRSLGLALSPTIDQSDIPPEIWHLVKQRQDARAKKDFATADRLREEIQLHGYQIIDSTDGPTVEKKTVS